MKKLLIFVSNHATLGDTDEANGTYAAELTHAVAEFKDANLGYDIASIKGGEAPLYGVDEADDAAHKAIMADAVFKQKVQSTLKASEVDLVDYDAVFYPGGFGLLSDLATNNEVAALTAELFERGAVVGAVCHGPAALLPIMLSNGDQLLANKKVTSFTRDEEVAGETIDKVPFVLEDVITRAANAFSSVENWQEHIVVDGQLITGQNPASAHAVAKAMVKALS